ncbi:septum formation initiator family protein [Telmatospirillum sp. J64-1]|uniref:FtsB family cell division protein n=1 Tax=Telmatospirillum sp. J64-1 TaxID=2502183 RepID=UPI00163DAE51|nr:septum formation initiator family protein [Telmatospirillum sp. J64-1]
MNILGEIRRRSRHIIGPLLGVSAIVYFGYHTIQGDRGLLAWHRLGQEIKEAEQVLARVQEERDQLAHRVSLLRPESLDPDMLEERARMMLHMGRDDEIVILTPTR